MACTHESTRWVGDTPISNVETLEFEGRFDTLQCNNIECDTLLDRAPVGSKVRSE